MVDHHTIQAFDEHGNKISFAIYGTDFTVTTFSAADPVTTTVVVTTTKQFEVQLRAIDRIVIVLQNQALATTLEAAARQ
jgi:hypothetical protein